MLMNFSLNQAIKKKFADANIPFTCTKEYMKMIHDINRIILNLLFVQELLDKDDGHNQKNTDIEKIAT